MSNRGRVLTLVIQIETNEYPQWIMDAHLIGPQNGVRVWGVCEGNVLAASEELAEKVEELLERLDK